MRTGITVQLSPEDRVRLDKVIADRNTPQKHVRRAQIVLLTADGAGTMEIMERTGQSKPTVWRWQARFAEAGVEGLLRDKTRPPGRKPLSEATVRQVVTKTTTERPADATHWSARAMAKAVGIAVSSVQKIWRAHGLKPHQVRTFKLSNDPAFEAKLVDVVGLYLDPPDRALVLSVDEKSQIQALDRTQPGLPLKKGRHPDPRLQAPRHHDAVRRPQPAGWDRDRALHGQAPAPGVHQVPRDDRRQYAGRSRSASDR
jgi:transposase